MVDSQKKSNFPLILLLSLSTWLTFWPTFQYPLAKKEDRLLQEQVQNATFFSHWQHYRHFAYHPIPRLSHGFDTFFWGQNLFGFRLTNTLLHLLLAILYFYFLLSFFPKPWWCGGASLLLLLHPLQVENLLTYTGRSALLGQIFLLLSFYLARQMLPPSPSYRRIGGFIGFGLFQCMAFFSWELLILTPFLLLFLVKHSKKTFLGISLFLALFVTSIHLGIAYQQKTGWAGWQGDTIESNLATRLPVLLEQWSEFFFPVQLSIAYTIPLRSFQSGLVWLTLFVGFLWISIYFLEKMPARGLWISLLWIPFVFSLGPFPQKFVKQDGTQALFLMGMIFWMTHFFAQRKRTTWARIFFCGIALCWGCLSWNLSMAWKSEQTLWEQARNSIKGGTSAQFQLGLFFLEQGQFQEARKEFEQVLTNPLDWETTFWAHIKLSVLCLQENQDGQALLHLKKAEKLTEQETRILFLKDKLYYVYQNQAQIYDRRSLADEAQIYWKKLISLYPQEIYPRMSLAFSQNQFGMPTRAINTLVEVLTIDHKYYLARLQMGKIYFNLKEYELAKEQFLRVLEHPLPATDEKETLYNLALTHHCLNEYEEEETCLRKAFAVDSTSWLIQRDLALIEKRKGNIEEAIESFKRTLVLLQNNGESRTSPRYQNLLLEISALFLVKSKIAYEQKNLKKAGEEIGNALAVTPENPQALYEDAFFEKRRGDLFLAQEKFLRLLEKHPAYYEAYRELGYIALQEKRRAEGIQFFEKYLNALPATKKESRERIEQIILNYEWEVYLQKIIATVTTPSHSELFLEHELDALKKARAEDPPENSLLQERLNEYLHRKEVAFYFQQAKKCLQNQAFTDAIDFLNRVLLLEETHWESYLLKGLILIQQSPEQIEQIEETLQKATRYNAEHPQAFYVLGCYYQDLGYQAETQNLPDSAKKWFREAKKWFVLCLSKDQDQFYTAQIRIYLTLLKEK